MNIQNEQEDFGVKLDDALSRVIRQAIKQELTDSTSRPDETDRLLNVTEAAKVLNVSKDWLYDHAKKFPFTLKLGPKMLRFSSRGIQKFQEMRQGRC